MTGALAYASQKELSEAVKKAETKPKVEWVKCLKCQGSIPSHWKRHQKCGWNIEKKAFPLQMKDDKVMPNQFQELFLEAKKFIEEEFGEYSPEERGRFINTYVIQISKSKFINRI